MAKNRALRKTRSGKRLFLRRLVDFLILAVVVWLAFTLAGRSLRQVAVARLTELTNAKIKAKSIDFNFDGSVSIEKLVITPEQIRDRDDAILKAEKMYARFDLGSLLLVRPRLREITVNDFVFNAQYDLDAGLWNTTGLKFDVPKDGTGQVPVVRLEKGALQYIRVSDGQVKVVTKVPIDAIFEPAEDSPAAYSFRIKTAETARDVKSTLNGSWQAGRITITGGISSADIPTLERAWDIKALAADLTYDVNNIYSLKLRIKDLIGSRDVGSGASAFDESPLLKSWGLFDALQRFFRRYRPAGQIDFDLQASGNLKRLRASKLSGKVHCKDVSIRDVNFPYLVEHIAGDVDFTGNRVTLNDLVGEHNDVNLTFNGWSQDFGAEWQYQIRIKSDNMALDEDLYEALNPKQEKFWSAFSPSGTTAIDYTLRRQSENREKRSLKVELLDSVATYEKFPYPLKNLKGNLFFEGDGITISDLVSQYNGREITLNGKVAKLSTDRPSYDVSIRSKDVPLDSELAAALPAKQRSFYEQYDMTGLADAEVKIFTPEPNAGPTSFTADVSIKESSLHLEPLPLDINDISAKAVVGPNLVILEDFTGRYDQGPISLTGRIWPSDEAEQSGYCLTVRAERMELNEDLIELLPRSLGEYISKLQPKGKINLDANLNKAGGDDCPDYGLTVECLGNNVSYSFAKETPDAGSDNFKPAVYPLKDVTGKLIITADSIKLDNITAAANDVQPAAITPTIRLNGQITLADDAFSGGRLALSADDVSFDERLLVALPDGLRDLYVKLAPVGRFDLSLEDINMSPAGDGESDIEFAGTAKLKTCNLNIWPAVTELDALLDVNCLYNTGGGLRDGRASVFADSLQVSGKSMTSLKADLNYDRRRQSWAADGFIADCYGGKLTGKFEFKQPTGEPSEYLLQVGFNNIDLKEFLSEPNRNEARLAALSEQVDESRAALPDSKLNGDTSGKMSGSLSLTTGAGGSSSHLGRCRLIITDMYIGKPSPLAKLLYVLQLTDSRDFVFERMFVDSYIKNDRLVFEKFDLSGESLAFNGSGSMDLPTRDVNLTLTVRGERLADAEPSVLQSLAENIGSGVVRMKVTGNAYDPQVEIKTLPVIKDSLSILGTKTSKAD